MKPTEAACASERIFAKIAAPCEWADLRQESLGVRVGVAVGAFADPGYSAPRFAVYDRRCRPADAGLQSVREDSTVTGRADRSAVDERFVDRVAWLHAGWDRR